MMRMLGSSIIVAVGEGVKNWVMDRIGIGWTRARAFNMMILICRQMVAAQTSEASMFTYTITIGRGTGQRELSAVMWATFEDEVNELLSAFVAPGEDTVEVHTGVGVWQGETEESTKTTLLIERDLSPANRIELRRSLSRLAKRYGQDAIALTIGQSELVTK